MVIYIKANFQIIYFMEKENILIIMVTHMKDNLFMVKKKEKVFINVLTYMTMGKNPSKHFLIMRKI